MSVATQSQQEDQRFANFGRTPEGYKRPFTLEEELEYDGMPVSEIPAHVERMRLMYVGEFHPTWRELFEENPPEEDVPSYECSEQEDCSMEEEEEEDDGTYF